MIGGYVNMLRIHVGVEVLGYIYIMLDIRFYGLK